VREEHKVQINILGVEVHPSRFGRLLLKEPVNNRAPTPGVPVHRLDPTLVWRQPDAPSQAVLLGWRLEQLLLRLLMLLMGWRLPRSLALLWSVPLRPSPFQRGLLPRPVGLLRLLLRMRLVQLRLRAVLGRLRLPGLLARSCLLDAAKGGSRELLDVLGAP